MPVDKAAGPNNPDDVSQDAARKVADQVIDHLRTMYPDALKAVPSSAAISLRNMTTSAVARAIDAATAAEREACAQVADDTYVVPSQGLHPYQINAANKRAGQIATAIRNRGASK